MTRINTNIASLRGLHNVQKAQGDLNQSLQRLSTGLQINSGRDNPSGLIASEGLRLQVTTINQSISNSNRANNVLSTADSALGEIGGLLNQVRGLVQEGLNNGALSSDEIKANQQQIDQALSAINRISANTSFGGQKLIDGSKSFNTAVTAADAAKLSDYQINEALFGQSSSININATVTSAAEKGELRYNGGSLTSATTLEVAGTKGNQVLFLGGSSTVTNVKDAVNAVKDVTGVEATLRSGATVGTVTGVAAAKTFTAGSDTVTVTANSTGIAGNNITVAFVAGSGNNVATSAAQVGNAITVTLGTDGAGAVDATKNKANQIAAAINSISGGTATATSSGTTTGYTAAAAANLTGGVDNAPGAVKFTDARPEGTAGTISVVFANPGSNNAALSVGVSGNVITVNLATNGSGAITSTAANVVTAIQASTQASALVNVQATTSGVVGASASTNLTQGVDAELVLKSTDYGSKQFVQLNVLSGSFATTLNNETTASYRDAGTDIQANINGQAALGDGLKTTVKTGILDASLNFTAASNVANTTATVSVTGGGSLFQIGQEVNASGQIGIGIDAVNTARLGGVTGKLYQLGTGGGKSLLDVGPNVPASDLVNIIDQALTKVNTLRGRLGAIQKDVIDTNVSTLGVALENISSARSQIVDTDFAAETANLQKSQVLSQAGISVLTIANQVPQQVLALLR